MTKRLKGAVKDVELALIDEPDGVARLEIDQEYISELAQSIREIGLLQPILLAIKGDRFEIVAGHMRYLAHYKAGLSKIRAVVRDLTREQIVIMRATENLARKDLTPVEEAITYNDLYETHGISIQDIAQRVGKSPGLIKRRIDLLRMPEELTQALHLKRISISVAEELWPISDPAQLSYYLSFALDGGCTRTVARQWCKDWKDSVRRKGNAGEPGGEPLSPQEPRPTFLPCDLCLNPVELGKDIVMRICPSCNSTIQKAVKGTD
jgi:ParB family chromosome partitioning protein